MEALNRVNAQFDLGLTNHEIEATPELRAGEIYSIRRAIKIGQRALQTLDEQMIDRVLRRVARRFLTASATRGRCFVCGCSNVRDCAGGCSWENEEQTLCDRCSKA